MLFGTPRMGPQVHRTGTSGSAGAQGEGRRLLPRERGGGAGAAGQAKTSHPSPWLPRTRTEILWVVLRKQRGRESFVRLKCLRAAAATAVGTLGKTADSLHFLPSASGGVNPAQDEAAGDRATRVPVPDYSNKVEKGSTALGNLGAQGRPAPLPRPAREVK